MNVTELPGQTEELGVLIFTVGATAELIVIVITFDVALAGTAHDALDVITHFTVWPFVSVEVVNVALFVPALVPFTCH